MKSIFLILAAVFGGLLLASILFWGDKEGERYSEFGNPFATLAINGRVFRAEIVSTEKKRQQGLSGREKLCSDCAMAFIFDRTGAHPFWMKDMKFDLDVIWINGEKIVAIKKNISHMRGSLEVADPGVEADKVLEINAGESDALGLKEGDSIVFQ